MSYSTKGKGTKVITNSKSEDSFHRNCRMIDNQFFMGLPSATIYNFWEDHSAEQQYILDYHFDEELEMYFGKSRL